MAASDRSGRVMSGERLFRSLFRRGVVANLVGATVAFVYLSFVAPPKPAPPHGERFLFMGVVPVYVLVALIVGYRISRRRFRPIDRWLAENRLPSREERALVLSLPWRSAGLTALGWLVAVVIFGVVTGTHHPAAFVAGVVLGIALAGLTTAAVSFLLAERTL